MRLSSPWGRIKDKEVVVHILVHLHDTCLVSASVAIVWSREDGDYVLFMRPVVAIHHELMGTRDQL